MLSAHLLFFAMLLLKLFHANRFMIKVAFLVSDEGIDRYTILYGVDMLYDTLYTILQILRIKSFNFCLSS